jgi:hypothetical protein
MRVEIGLFSKKRPTERCDMLGTRPGRIASSAMSRWLERPIGRSLSEGFSQVIAITVQICSGVCVAGAPDRGASVSRSGTDCPSAACRHRLRQYRTVFGHTSSSRALSRTPTPSAACSIMRVHKANCWGVERLRIAVPAPRAARARQSPGRQIGDSNLLSQLPIRHAQHSRFDSSFFVRRIHLRSLYLRTLAGAES